MNAFRKIDEERNENNNYLVTTEMSESDYEETKSRMSDYHRREMQRAARKQNDDTFKLFNYSGRHNFAINKLNKQRKQRSRSNNK